MGRKLTVASPWKADADALDTPVVCWGMFPHEKQNLINYRFVLGWTAVLFVVCVGVGVLMRKQVGWAFAAMQAYALFALARGLFQWWPEPTAKRQFVTAIAVHAALGTAGYYLINCAIDSYLML